MAGCIEVSGWGGLQRVVELWWIVEGYLEGCGGLHRDVELWRVAEGCRIVVGCMEV